MSCTDLAEELEELVSCVSLFTVDDVNLEGVLDSVLVGGGRNSFQDVLKMDLGLLLQVSIRDLDSGLLGFVLGDGKVEVGEFKFKHLLVGLVWLEGQVLGDEELWLGGFLCFGDIIHVISEALDVPSWVEAV